MPLLVIPSDLPLFGRCFMHQMNEADDGPAVSKAGEMGFQVVEHGCALNSTTVLGFPVVAICF